MPPPLHRAHCLNKSRLIILCLSYINWCVVKFKHQIGTAIYSLQKLKWLNSLNLNELLSHRLFVENKTDTQTKTWFYTIRGAFQYYNQYKYDYFECLMKASSERWSGYCTNRCTTNAISVFFFTIWLINLNIRLASLVSFPIRALLLFTPYHISFLIILILLLRYLFG